MNLYRNSHCDLQNFIVAILLCGLSLCGMSAYGAQEHRALRIGILRHLTIEEAKKRGIDSEAEQLLLKTAEQRGHHIELIDPTKLVLSTSSSSHFDVLISRAEIDDIANPITDSYFRALDYFETLGTLVINGHHATLNAQDKFRTLMLAKQIGIRVPFTCIVYSLQEIQNLVIAKSLIYPFFVKHPYGGAGRAVFKVHNEEALIALINGRFTQGEAILVEEEIDLETDEQGNVRDMRLWVVKNATTNASQYIGGALRTARAGHYLTNLSAGGTLSKLLYDPKIAEMAERALDAIEGDVAGIDVGKDKKGNLWLIEVNISFYTNPSFQDLIGVNIWDRVMDLVEARAYSKLSSMEKNYQRRML
jgi:RimK family alpha-L-glutamate ligase